MPRCEAAGAPIHSAPMVGSLGIVLPAFNEEARLGPALDELFAYLCSKPAAAALPELIEVLVVDDGSTDGTAGAGEGPGRVRRWARRASAAPRPAARRCGC